MAEQADIQTIHVRIEGKVQGVWYRAWTIEQANQFGLCGWVRNRIDGSVEAVFSGAEATVRLMINAAYDGPPHAKVTRIIETVLPFERFAGFSRKSTI